MFPSFLFTKSSAMSKINTITKVKPKLRVRRRLWPGPGPKQQVLHRGEWITVEGNYEQCRAFADRSSALVAGLVVGDALLVGLVPLPTDIGRTAIL